MQKQDTQDGAQVAPSSEKIQLTQIETGRAFTCGIKGYRVRPGVYALSFPNFTAEGMGDLWDNVNPFIMESAEDGIYICVTRPGKEGEDAAALDRVLRKKRFETNPPELVFESEGEEPVPLLFVAALKDSEVPD